MKRILFQLCLPLFATSLCSQGYSDEYPTNLMDWTNLIPSINAKADLGALLHGNIKESIPSDFDGQICSSLSIKSKLPMIISFREISFVFHYRTAKACIKSSQEMSSWWDLIYRDGEITRTNSADQVPFNNIGLVDPSVTNEMVEIDLLLGVAPLEKLQDVKYVRRSFRFVYNNGWKESDSGNPQTAIERTRANYNAALKDATDSIPFAVEFVRLFPNTKSFFSYYTGVAGTPELNMVTTLYERYELTMQADVSFEIARNKVATFGNPQFYLWEVSNVKKLAGGSWNVSYDPSGGRTFGIDEWKKIVRAHGDFASIGYHFVTNHPVLDFEQWFDGHY